LSIERESETGKKRDGLLEIAYWEINKDFRRHALLLVNLLSDLTLLSGLRSDSPLTCNSVLNNLAVTAQSGVPSSWVLVCNGLEAKCHRQFVQDLPGFGNGECKLSKQGPTISKSERGFGSNASPNFELIAEEKQARRTLAKSAAFATSTTP